MLRLLRRFALVIFVAAPLQAAADSTPAPPDWKDGQSSVYSKLGRKERPSSDAAPAIPAEPAPSQQLASVEAAGTHESSAPPIEPSRAADASSRYLAPPTVRRADAKDDHVPNGKRRLVDFGIPTESIYTVVTALAIVIGAFLLFVWALRRGARSSARRGGMLPAEAVSLLGRVRITGRQMAELLRVGNKLVLVALTPTGAETLTEVTDPVEVDRLTGICQQHDRHSTTNAFEQVMQQLSREPASGGFLGADSLPASLSPVAAAYRSHRGDRARV